MKHILISIKPQWVEKILNGEKTIEIRKSMPKCELPCKVYIYCTKGKDLWMHNKETIILGNTDLTSYWLNGKVVAEFTLNKVEKIKFDCPCSFSSFNMGFGFTENRYNIDVTKTCLTESQLYDYLGEPFEIQGEYHQTFEFSGYAWHIDNLKIYDTPKDIMQFIRTSNCNNCLSYKYQPQNERFDLCNRCKEFRTITRPPQSWCYVEEIGEEV